MCSYIVKVLKSTTYDTFGWLFFGDKVSIFHPWEEVSIHEQESGMWLLYNCIHVYFMCGERNYLWLKWSQSVLFLTNTYCRSCCQSFPRKPSYSSDGGRSHVIGLGQQDLGTCDLCHIPVEALNTVCGRARPLLFFLPQDWACLQSDSSFRLALQMRGHLEQSRAWP